MALPVWQSFSHASTSLGADPVVAKPSGTVDGNLMIASGVAGGGGVLTAPAGWTQLLGSFLWWKIASGEPSNYTWTLSGATTTGLIVIDRFTFHDPSPIDVVQGVSAPNGTLNIVIPSVTPTGANRLLFQTVARAAASASFTPPGTAVERRDAAAPTALLSDAGGDEAVGASPTGTRTWVPSTSSGQALGFMVAIKPLLPESGSVSGAASTSGSFAGSHTSEGSVAGAVSTAGSFAGSRTPEGSVAGAVAVSGNFAGSRTSEGSVAGAVATSGAFSGSNGSTNEFAGSVTTSGSFAGSHVSSGDVAGATTTAGSVAGSAEHSGQIAGAVSTDGDFEGSTQHSGSTAGAVSSSGTAVGSSVHEGSVAGAVSASGSFSGNNGDTNGFSGSVSTTGSVAGTRKSSGSFSSGVSTGGAVVGRRRARGTFSGSVSSNGAVQGGSRTAGSFIGSVSTSCVVTGSIASRGTVSGVVGTTGVMRGRNRPPFTHRATIIDRSRTHRIIEDPREFTAVEHSRSVHIREI
jgi:hypothetical protein